VRVAGCTFADNYLSASFISSPNKKGMNVTVANNIILGPGPLEATDIYGIRIAEGVGGRIAGNTISGYSYVGPEDPFPVSIGIVAFNEANFPPFGILEQLEIEGNTLRDNQIHIALVVGNGSVVRNNRFQGTAPGLVPAGLAVTGTNVTIANNQFKDMPVGIRLIGDDPLFGTVLGSAVNAQITTNRFCGVTTNIIVQPLASASEAGTTLGSCSSNTLTIAPAVLVSWPEEEGGWAIESANTVKGPWIPSDATPFMQHGRRSIAVPTEGTHQFFRTR
jgi:hypothetical protein